MTSSAVSGPAPHTTTIGVSIPIPEPVGSQLQARRASYGDPLAERVPSHITLLGPTQVSDDQLRNFEQHCQAVAAAHAPFRVKLRGAGTFRPVSDVVFVQVASGVADCEGLEVALRSGPVERKLDFYYHPHVTIAHNVPHEQLDRAFEDFADFRLDFDVEAIHLYVLGVDEVWRPVRTFALEGDS